MLYTVRRISRFGSNHSSRRRAMRLLLTLSSMAVFTTLVACREVKQVPIGDPAVADMILVLKLATGHVDYVKVATFEKFRPTHW
jgi:hypothetical protein